MKTMLVMAMGLMLCACASPRVYWAADVQARVTREHKGDLKIELGFVEDGTVVWRSPVLNELIATPEIVPWPVEQ